MKLSTSILLVTLIFFCSVSVNAQLSRAIPPQSLSYGLRQVTKAVDMPAINRRQLDQEDAVEDLFTQPQRVAYPFPVALDMKSGQWADLPDGSRIWRLKVRAKGAQAISLLYDQFFLPPGATMHLYNPNTGETHGAFTERNNKPSRKFATALTYGDEVVLEYYEPAAQRGQGEIRVSQVGHAYRLLEVATEAERAMNSGSCQVGVNCSPEGDSWQDQKKSVARMLVNGSAFCTGSLINNSLQDGKAYFLTADHCIGSLDAISNSDASFYTFNWNHERIGCGNSGSGSFGQTTSGATLRSNSFSGDYALFELTENPATQYDVYFAGFSAAASPPSGGVGIHHPRGDYKKIATHSITPVSFSFGGRPANSYWNISWDATPNGHSVTEGGSSGSPLFNSSGLVIGQLFGGSSINCTDPARDPGWYGKISYNWTNGGATSPQRRLRDWLDPTGGTVLSVGGAYLSGPLPNVTITGNTSYVANEAITSGVTDCRGYRDFDIPVELSRDAGTPVTIFGSLSGTANSYDLTVLTNNLTLGGGGPTSGTITVRMYDDDEVEPEETAQFSIIVQGASAVPGSVTSVTFRVIDNDEPLGTPQPQPYLTESFDVGIGSGWTTTNTGAAVTGWQAVASQSGNTLDGSPMIISNSSAGGTGSITNATITSPALDVSAASSLTLSFDEYFRAFTGGTNEKASVEVFFNGFWYKALEHTQAGGSIGDWGTPQTQSINLSQFASNNFRIRFRYVAADDWYWAVDNVRLIGSGPASVATSLTQPSQVYLGPNQEVAVYDNVSGNAIVSIQNLSATDHGCTTVQIDRDASSGQTTFPFFTTDPTAEAYAKTLRISPAFSPNSGSYRLRWMFDGAEIAAWEASTGRTFGVEGGIAKVSGVTTFGTVTPANFGNFSVDWAPATTGSIAGLSYIETTFFSGFSSFGVVIDPAAPLPVELSAFSGEHRHGMGNVLRWTTASEYNNARFDVERSSDGTSFERLTSMLGAGTAHEAKSYRTVDEAPLGVLTYYRLRQVDLDGTEDLSEVIAVAADGLSFAAYLSSAQTLQVDVPTDLQAMILTDATGRTLQAWPALQPGSQRLELPANLPAGVFYAVAEWADGSRRTIKLVR